MFCSTHTCKFYLVVYCALYPTKICKIHDFVTVLSDTRMNNFDFHTKMQTEYSQHLSFLKFLSLNGFSHVEDKVFAEPYDK